MVWYDMVWYEMVWYGMVFMGVSAHWEMVLSTELDTCTPVSESRWRTEVGLRGIL